MAVEATTIDTQKSHCTRKEPQISDTAKPLLTEIPRGEFAYPGPLRDALVSAILAGEKTATTSLLAEYAVDEDPRDGVGALEAVIDSFGTIVCVTRCTDVRIMRLADVTQAHALAEGEGFTSVTQWRAAHEAFWRSPDHVAEYGEIDLTDETMVVCSTFVIDDAYPITSLRPWDCVD